MVTDRHEHNKAQAAWFDKQEVVEQFCQPVPCEVNERLREVVSAVPGLGPESRVVDLGAGTGALIPHLQSRGVKDIVAVDVSEGMLAALSARYVSGSTLGNDLGVRPWQGDLPEVPVYMGPVDAIFMNAVFGNVHSQRDTLAKAGLMLKPGGHCVISHPMGRAWHGDLRTRFGDALVPHELPADTAAWKQLLRGLPLRLASLRDETNMYLAMLQAPPHYEFEGAPVRMASEVVKGFGRGSKQMGVPTANIDPGPLKDVLADLPTGVYFGWARLDAPDSWPEADRAVHKMVMNMGKRPTVNVSGQEALTVEVHMLHPFSQEFYGLQLRVVALGFIRPEMRFPGGLGELVARIKADVATAKLQLDTPAMQAHASDPFLLQ